MINLNQIKGGKDLKQDVLNALTIWKSGTKYVESQNVLLGNKIYKCKIDNQDEDFDETKWEQIQEILTNNFATKEDIDSLFE